MLTNEEFAIVRRLAEGDGSYRAAAEQVFKDRLSEHVATGRKDPAMNFLSETFNKVPDHTLRSKYRAQVLATTDPENAMYTRYVVEKVAKQPDMRRLKDTERNRYVKQPHGADLWPLAAAQAKATELNATAHTAH